MPQKYKVFQTCQEGSHQALLYHISLFFNPPVFFFSSGLKIFRIYLDIIIKDSAVISCCCAFRITEGVNGFNIFLMPFLSFFNVIKRLKVHPEFCGDTEKLAEL